MGDPAFSRRDICTRHRCDTDGVAVEIACALTRRYKNALSCGPNGDWPKPVSTFKLPLRSEKPSLHQTFQHVVEAGDLLPAASDQRDLAGAVRPGTGPQETAPKARVTGSTVPEGGPPPRRRARTDASSPACPASAACKSRRLLADRPLHIKQSNHRPHNRFNKFVFR